MPIVRLLLGAALLAAAAPGAESVSTVVNRAIEAQSPMITEGEKAAINAKCGKPAGDWRGVRFESAGVLVCGNGKRVSDPETRAMSRRIAARASAYVNSVMRSPEVAAALDTEVSARVREAMTRMRADLARDDARR